MRRGALRPGRVGRAGRPGVAAALLAAGVMVAGCDSATDPPFASGTVSFEYQAPGDAAPTVWSATGACGTRGFELGSSTCAVGSEERSYLAALGVLRGEDAFGTLTVAFPRTEGTTTCAASGATGSTCGVEFRPVRADLSEEPPPFWVMTTGTVTGTVEEGGEEPRFTGTFEGTLTDPNGNEAPLTVTNGTFDVELVR